MKNRFDRRINVVFVTLISLFMAAFMLFPTSVYALTEYSVIYGPGDAFGPSDLEYVTEGTEITLPSPDEFGYVANEGTEFDCWSIRKETGMGEEIAKNSPEKSLPLHRIFA